MLGLGSRPFVVGDLTNPLSRRSRAKQILDVNQLEHVKEGDLVTRWGWIMEWGPGCVRPSALEELRHHGDDKSDAVVRFFNLKAGEDGLKRLQTYLADTPEDAWDPNVRAFWTDVARDPPEEVTALAPSHEHLRRLQTMREEKEAEIHGHSSHYGDFERGSSVPRDSKKTSKRRHSDLHENLDGSNSLPADPEYTPERAIQEQNRACLPVLSEGQAVFWRYSGDMFTTLLHFSLAGGFASARIMSVLYETGYLTSKSRDATYRRLMETTQALVDFMGDMRPVTGKGWQSAVRVRLLHSQVRLRILDGRSKLKQYSVERDGIPVNQEDLIATLGGFCLAPLWCQKRLGITLTVQEELAFIAAWRHVGYYLGIMPESLSKWFNTDDPTTSTVSHRFFACVAFHLFASPIPPKDPFSTATYKILHAVAHRPPGDKSTLYHCELSRKLLGHGLANQLAIPRGSYREWLHVQQHSWNSWIIAQFSRRYTPRWAIHRQLVFRRIITLIVAWQLGERRSHFAWKEEADHEKKISELDSKEAGEPAGLEMGVRVGREVRSQIRWLFAEMGAILAGLGIIGGVMIFHTVRYAVRALP